MRALSFAVLAIFFTMPGFAVARRACIAPRNARDHIGKVVCVKAHIYRIVNAPGGVHFLDVCSPKTADADCHFILVSLDRDRSAVGDLQPLNGKTIEILGTVHMMQGHAEMVLRDRRQLRRVKKAFHPNPRLTKSFSAENKGRAFSTRNGTGGQRGVHLSHRGK